HKFSLADIEPDGAPVASPATLIPGPDARTVDDPSDFGLISQRQVAVIAETAYSGWGAKGDADESRWQLTLRPEWVHNLNALTDQRDGYVFQVDVGRQEEKGDLLFEHTWF